MNCTAFDVIRMRRQIWQWDCKIVTHEAVETTKFQCEISNDDAVLQNIISNLQTLLGKINVKFVQRNNFNRSQPNRSTTMHIDQISSFNAKLKTRSISLRPLFLSVESYEECMWLKGAEVSCIENKEMGGPRTSWSLQYIDIRRQQNDAINASQSTMHVISTAALTQGYRASHLQDGNVLVYQCITVQRLFE